MSLQSRHIYNYLILLYLIGTLDISPFPGVLLQF